MIIALSISIVSALVALSSFILVYRRVYAFLPPPLVPGTKVPLGPLTFHLTRVFYDNESDAIIVELQDSDSFIREGQLLEEE